MTGTGTPTERRRDVRREVCVEARLTLVGLTVEGRIENVGAHGFCFATRDPHLRVEPGNFVRIAWEGEPVGRAVRVTRVDRLETGDGVERRLGLEIDALPLLDVERF